MKGLLVAVLLFLFGFPSFALQATLDGWAVTNYFSDIKDSPSGQNSIQIDVEITLDEPVARLVQRVDLAGTRPEASIYALIEDLKVDSETQFTVRFNKWNVYSESNRFFIPAGPCELKFQLSDGRTFAMVIVLGSPNFPKLLGSSFVSSSSPNRSIDGSIPILEIPKISNVYRDSSGIKLSFALGDDKSFSGVIQLYDGEGRFIGASPAFVDFMSGNASPYLNVGEPFKQLGQTNTVSVPSPAFTMRPNRSFLEATEILLLITDGRQYLGSSVPTWDFMAAVRTGIELHE